MNKITLGYKKIFLTIILFLLHLLSYSQTVIIDNTPAGTETFTVPAGVSKLKVEVWGGGGKGGSRTSNGGGGGGGGGGYAMKIVDVTPGTTYNYQVGAGSITATSPATSDSWFLNNTTVLAKRGTSVNTTTTTAAGTGATIGIGDITYAGGTGVLGATYGGGGGSSAGTAANGVTGTTFTGGTAPIGGGNGGNGWNTTTNGSGLVGISPGGGGGGSYMNGGTPTGGNGANGQIRFSYSFSEISIWGGTPNDDIADGATVPAAIEGTDYGSTNINTSVTRTYSIINYGLGTLNISGYNITGTNSSEFVITTPPTSLTIAPQSSTTFTVTFTPSGIGTRSATINIFNDDTDEAIFNFNVSGIGTAPEIAVATIAGGTTTNIVDNAVAGATGTPTNFGTQNTTSYVTRTFTISNSGNGPLTIGTITNSNTTDYTVSALSSPSPIAVGSSASFTITFYPVAAGTKTAIISIPNNDIDESPFEINLTGVGTTIASTEINIKDVTSGLDIPINDVASLTKGTDFGSQNVISGSTTRVFRIQNTGTLPLNTTSNITFTGATGSFSVSPTTPGIIAGGGYVDITVTFDPNASGTQNAVISIPNDDANEAPYTFNLTGFGTNPEIVIEGGSTLTNIVDNTTAVVTNGTDFATQFTGVTTTRTYKISNTGNGPLTIGAITANGSYVFSTISSPIAAGGSTTFTITLGPVGTGTYNSIASIVTNDSDENPFRIQLTGTVNGTNAAEINIRGGSPLTDINVGDAASTAKGTDFGSQYIISGVVTKTFTIYNTGGTALTIGAINITGAAASDFTFTTPATPIAATTGSSTFNITFDPSAFGTRSAVVSIVNGDSNESPYTFNLTGVGATYNDSDADGVTDNIDIDDDNDGIRDSDEQTACEVSPLASSVETVFLNETFGTGTDRVGINISNPGASTQYSLYTNTDRQVFDGKYVVYYKLGSATNSSTDPQTVGTWAHYGLTVSDDHTTGDTNGRMAFFNATATVGQTFYELPIDGIVANIPVSFDFWAINTDRSNQDYIDLGHAGEQPRLIPRIRVDFVSTTSGEVLATYDTGDITRCNSGILCNPSDWKNFIYTPNLGAVTSFKIRLSNISVGGNGNDIALDDIRITQTYCDNDSDGYPDIVDLDADNDGIPDIVEAGFKTLSNNQSKMVGQTDANGNGMADAIDGYISNGTYASNYLPDTDGDGVKDFIDLDSDNDTIFDIDESNSDSYSAYYNGDGDVDGDGKGETSDPDKDGIQTLNDDFVGYGSTFKAYPTDTDSDGIPDYLDTTSNGGTTNFDINNTLFKSFDTNNDGKIDTIGDSDKDGIPDEFDNNDAKLGSPRNIIDRKLLLEFDGRNDYAEGPSYLNNVATATLMGWIKLDTNFTNTGVIMGQDKFYISINSSKQLVATAKTTGLTYTTTPLDKNRWYHVAAVYNGGDSTGYLRLYLNGNPVILSAAGGYSGNLGTSVNNFTIGRTPGISSSYFRGFIDEVRLFDSALTADQIQKMVYQEIDANGTVIRGTVIPKDIESSVWANLKSYLRMDNYKNDVIDDYKIAGIDDGLSTAFTRIYNAKYIKLQSAPMPFQTIGDGAIESVVSPVGSFIQGTDVNTIDWSIVKVDHNVTSNANRADIGLFVGTTGSYTANNDNKLENSWYLKLDGKIDLQGMSQLVQKTNSELATSSSGYIERDQQGQVNVFNYNYWSSPVSPIQATANNTNYTIAGVMKDGLNATPRDLLWSSGYNGTAGSASTPTTLSSYWLNIFESKIDDYANWIKISETSSLRVGQGFTAKGSGGTSNFTFVGKPNNGTIANPLNKAGADELFLTGNPYPSALDSNKFITDNAILSTTDNLGTDGTLYFWEHSSDNNSHYLAQYRGGYAVRNLLAGLPPVVASNISGNVGLSAKIPNQNIPVGQGFFVYGNATGGTIVFNNSQRIFAKETDTSSNTLFKINPTNKKDKTLPIIINGSDPLEKNTNKIIRIGFDTYNKYHRQVILGFADEKATSAIDYGYDSYILDDFSSDMFLLNGEDQLVIEGEGYFDPYSSYPIGVKADSEGEVSFMIDGLENFDSNQDIFLYDDADKTYHNIKTENYTTTLAKGENNSRFSLRFTDKSLGVIENKTKDVSIIFAQNTNTLTINNTLADLTVEKVVLFNIIGQSIGVWDVSNQEQQNIKVPMKAISSGVYIAKIKTSKGFMSKKIVLNK